MNSDQSKVDKMKRNDRMIPSVRYDFQDKEWIRKPGIGLLRYNDRKIALIGRKVIPMLSSRFTGEGIASIFELAYHLKAPDCRFRLFVFNPERCIESTADEVYDAYWNGITSVNSDMITGTEKDVTREAALYSYIAVSLFRLFAKPVSSYLNTWHKIVEKFLEFYKESMIVNLPVPTKSALQDVRNFFCMHERAKVCLYRFLYMSSSDERPKDLKNFLYDKHLSNNGLYIVHIITQLCDVFNCSPGLIVTAVGDKATEKQMKCLVHVSELLTQNDWNHQNKMWRFGRIFDGTFMRDIQTRWCLKLVYILAEALRSEAPEKYSSVLQITQFANLNNNDKMRCTVLAQQFLTQLKSLQ